MMRRGSLVVAAALAAGTLLGVATPTRAAEYTMETDARYALSETANEVAVTVDVRFENTTPDPPGKFSAFEVVDLALQAGAAGVTAQDGDGPLQLTLDERSGYVVASVRARAAVRYGDVASFSVTYTLPDGASDEVRVRPSVVTFPAWSFGTSGTVTVVLPEAYEVRVAGSSLTPRTEDGSVVLESGEIADPGGWLARITATRPSSFTTVARTVPLASGTVDLQVRAWADDASWGTRVADLVEAALPALEAEIALPYPRANPLVVVESVPNPTSSVGEPQPGSGEVDVAYDEPDFTVLHQVAHVWLSPTLAADAWIREGFASSAAARVAGQLGVALPFDPAARAQEMADGAFPLVSWGQDAVTTDQDAWAYAASWVVADRLSGLVGVAALRDVWARVAAGRSAYDPPGSSTPDATTGAAPAVDSRALLDQLEAASGLDLSTLFRDAVFDPATAALLPARATARAAYRDLLALAGSWGAPDPVRSHLAGWRFDEAQAAMDQAAAWLADRDALVDRMAALDLVPPSRLRDAYRTDGGGTAARTELDAETAVVDRYAEAAARVAASDPSILARIGLLGSASPATRLEGAGSLISAGELRGASDALDALIGSLDRADLDGAVRLGAAAALVLLLVGGLAVVLRRRPGSGYTSAP